MALSVLVALMMLAVPLASSSNLFVDGGQTNSNGDAPLLGDASYRVDFILNESSDGRISLDEVADLSTLITNLNTGSSGGPVVAGATWYQDEKGNLFAVVTGDVTIQQLIWALTKTPGQTATFDITKTGYILDSFVNNDDKSAFGPDKDQKHTTAPTGGDKITKNMTFTAKWLLDDSKYAQLDVDVLIDGETKEYVKVFPKFKESDETNIDEKNVYITAAGTFIEKGISDLSTYGIIINATGSEEKSIDEVYSFKTTYGDDKEIAKTAVDLKVPITSKLTMTYTFDDKKFSKIEVKSEAFDKEIFKDGIVTLYASKLRAYTYVQAYDALTDSALKNDTNAGKLTYDVPILTVGANFVTADGYKLTGWNEGAELLKSENNASSPLTLDAELNGYYVIFMVNGQFEYVYVPFGELSADKTTLDVTGVNHWVWMKYSDYKKGLFTNIKSFNFASSADVKNVEDVTGRTNDKEPTAVLIACFTPSSSTSYAVFDASSYTYSLNEAGTDFASGSPTDGPEGTFGNEYVQYVIIPGKVGNSIPTPAETPVYDEESKVLFISWNHVPVKDNIDNNALIIPPYSNKDKFGAANTVTSYYANAVGYKYTITFYDGDKVVGTFYYDAIPTIDIKYGLVAWEIDGKVYGLDSPADESSKAFEKILAPEKDGYLIKQWDDANKNKVIEFKTVTNVDSSTGIQTIVDIKDMKDDLNLYSQFEAKNYKITYNNTFGDKMTQEGLSVDANVTLYGEVFLNDGFKLIGWSTSAGAAQPEYKLEGTFTLSGADYEDLVKKTGSANVNMYPVWEKLGSGSGTGGNTGGDNDNTALYLIAGMLAVIAILAIVGILLMRRK